MLLVGLGSLAGCLSGGPSWTWSHPDPGYAERQRQVDIDFCEQETDEISSNGPFSSASSRPYGEWGDFIFELCMEKRGWELIQGRADKGDE